MMTPYPGRLLDDEQGFRVLKCYIYKFVRNRIERKPRFDLEKRSFTEKKYFWFNTWRPLSGSYHEDSYIESFEAVKKESFIAEEKNVYFMPQYTQDKTTKKRKSYIYQCSGLDVAHYLSVMTLGDLQNITIFGSRFDWAVDLYEDTLPGHKDDMDVLVYVKRPA
ncbi:hypothetical protein N5D61_10345 [Pseudomonas sp. GD03842]|uniref:hypothetical protein n=1 Tax=Pseudomonas sp. GD03842 TaxID=2975385 RepID=UPI002446FE79|nr:hypothetical protein [Pseudomonas sp. GD03842]MDH0746745.1 hypothetical protein [Pseudomonas sp. GD03842]